ncbi:MAG TPA: DUF4389 domain-containing protein [Tepidiformaceae bacterium]|nr:DUF4389 domain-containing protein [Tepidiformaceae bacterium]
MSLPAGYPVTVDVDGPQPQNRLSVLLRLLYVLPHLIALYFVGFAAALGWFISWFAILVTGTYPPRILRLTHGFIRWSARANAYALLLTDKYPPFALSDEISYPVRVTMAEQATGRNRLTTFWPIRIIMAIPHLLIVGLLGNAVAVVVLIAWFAALFTGSVPPGLHNFVAGYLRWSTRANAYVYNVTDEYPPFGLN